MLVKNPYNLPGRKVKGYDVETDSEVRVLRKIIETVCEVCDKTSDASAARAGGALVGIAKRMTNQMFINSVEKLVAQNDVKALGPAIISTLADMEREGLAITEKRSKEFYAALDDLDRAYRAEFPLRLTLSAFEKLEGALTPELRARIVGAPRPINIMFAKRREPVELLRDIREDMESVRDFQALSGGITLAHGPVSKHTTKPHVLTQEEEQLLEMVDELTPATPEPMSKSMRPPVYLAR